MLDGFRGWYVARMTELAPPALRGGEGGPRDATVVVADSLSDTGRITLIRRRGGREQVAEPLDPRATGPVATAGPVTLRLPRGLLLERAITLPLVAEQGLHEVLGHEMDRYTPFQAADVAWSARVVSRDRAAEKIQVALTVLPRAPLQPLLAILARRGLTPTGIEAIGADRVTRTVPLTPPRAVRRSRFGLLAAGAIAILTVAAIGSPFLRLQVQSDAIEARIADLQPRFEQAQVLRKRIAAQANGNTALAAEQARLGDPLAAVAALTRVLPDDTYLMSLALHARVVSIEGQSAGASKLIGALSSDPVIQNAAFAAPVTRNDAGADLFSIRAEVRP